MKRCFILLLCGLPLCSQSFFASGATLLPQSSPRPTGWTALAIVANQVQQLYYFSEVDYTVDSQRRIQSSARSGLASKFRSYGHVELWGLADAGTATAGATAGGAFAGGAMLLLPTKRFTFIVGMRALKTSTGGSQRYIEIGFGKALK